MCGQVRAGGIIRRCVLTSLPDWSSGCTQLIIWPEIITEPWHSRAWVFLQFSGSRCTHYKIGLILPDIKLILNFQKRKKGFGKQMNLFTSSEIPFNPNNFKGLYNLESNHATQIYASQIFQIRKSEMLLYQVLSIWYFCPNIYS